ncbi:hypothetical protein GCM10010404_27730 [Nonomuraea africana]|uniref:Uncharacterized protein n=1 Tax=Nonomuraea africana TaxID=46171 RepID=A0ABR9KNJ3_9ACTN|nr:hypothetical protein [Nonomuraea africana]MBE1563594.1 hypothetical protein [Nonomuraea africana]
MWAAKFAGEHGLGREAIDRLIAFDRAGYPHREAFIGKVREHFSLFGSVGELWSRYRTRMPFPVRC